MKNKKIIPDCIIMGILGIVGAFNYALFIFPNNFAPAGINGIATMVQYLFDFSVGYMSLIVNIPLIIFAYLLLSKGYAVKTLVYVLVFSFAVIILKDMDLSRFAFSTENGTSTVLAPVAAGTVNGAIYGVVIKLNSSTGGTDILASYISKKKPFFNFVWITFAINTAVAVASYFVYDFKFEPVVCCIIYSFITGQISDAMIKGGKQALKFEVITSNAEELSARLIKNLRHSVTVINAQGMYSRTEKQLLICVVNKHQIIDFKNIINEFPNTFAYVSSVSETVGNFKKIEMK